MMTRHQLTLKNYRFHSCMRVSTITPSNYVETYMLLTDKVVLITGGAGLNGLGFATALQMASHGARVAIMDLERAEPANAAAQLGAEHMGVVASVTDKAAVDG